MDNNSHLDFQDKDILYRIKKIKVNDPIIGQVNIELGDISTLELFLDPMITTKIEQLEAEIADLKSIIKRIELLKNLE